MESESACERKWIRFNAIATCCSTYLLTFINIKPVLVNRDTLF